jgi:hypothetical protein
MEWNRKPSPGMFPQRLVQTHTKGKEEKSEIGIVHVVRSEEK